MTRVLRAAAWFALGWLGAFAMALATWSLSSLLFRAWSAMRRGVERWRTWQAATPDQRASWGEDRHDVWPTGHEMGRQK